MSDFQRESYLEREWNLIVDNTTQNAFVWFVFVLTLSSVVIYWFVGSIYLLMDWSKRPKWAQTYKIRDSKEKELDWETFLKISRNVLFNQIFVQISFATISYPLIGLIADPLEVVRYIPSIQECLVKVFVCWILREISFYYIHRLLHHGQFYVLFHKKHHSFSADTAISAIYCTPMEHILTNIVPIVLGPFILQLSFIPLFLWFTHITLLTLQEHSGYNFPWYYSLKHHRRHHQSFNKNYGVNGLMDWINGTLQ